jgi:uncharacterized iron-regulated membrane protein
MAAFPFTWLEEAVQHRRTAFGWLRWACLKGHRWLGLALGAIFALLGVTGSVNVFHSELEELLHPDTVVAAPPGPRRPLDEIFAAVERAEPARKGAWMLVMPHHARGMVSAWYDVPEERPLFHAPLVLTVDPTRAEVVSRTYWGTTPLTWIYDLHATLLAREAGWYVVGALGVAFLLSLVAALPLAWPGRGRVGSVFLVRRGSSAARANYDLHRAAGAWSALVLAIIAATGFCMVYGDAAARWLAHVSAPRQPFPTVHSTVRAGSPRLGIDAAVAAAQRVFPDAEPKVIHTPAGPDGAYQVALRQPGEVNRHYPATSVWIDAYSGAVLATRDARRFSAGEAFLSILYPLHNGGALGLFGRAVVFLAGLAPAVLLLTGFRAWCRRGRRSVPEARTLAPSVSGETTS